MLRLLLCYDVVHKMISMNVHQMIRTIVILLLVVLIYMEVTNKIVKQDTLGIKSQCRVQVWSNIGKLCVLLLSQYQYQCAVFL